MAKPICRKCSKRQHVITKFTKIKNKRYLITLCAVCKNGIDIEEYKEKK